MAFAVLRCAKVKQVSVSKVHNHNQRTYENHNSENINFERTNKNKVIIGSADTHKKLKENLLNLESKKAIRKDAVVLLEFIFSASPDFFYDNLDKEKFDKFTMKENKTELDKIFNESLNNEKLNLFQKSVIDFINSKQEFKNNVVNLTLHLDEKTPHFHLTLTPILENRLTAKTFFTPENARAWQNDFHQVLQKNNIVLERHKEFSTAVHQSLADYRSNELVDVPEPPVAAVQQQIDVRKIGTKVLLTDKVITTKTELEIVNRQIKSRENEQNKKYSFYKDFYNNSKVDYKKSKQLLKENVELKNKNEKIKKENFNMSSKIKKYTKEQLENLRQISLVQVAEKLGFKQSEKSGHHIRFKDNNVNIVINENTNQYADNTSQKNGFGAINFLKDFANLDFKQAVEFLGNDFSSIDISRELKENKAVDNIINETVSKIIQEIPSENSFNNKNVISYLTETRKIDKELVNELISSKKLYADKLNNCVFVSENKDFAFIRGTHKEKKFVANKGKMNFLEYENVKNSDQIFLFESVIDLLSYRTLNPEKTGKFVSIQGSAMINKLSELDLNSYKRVVCCFDNDAQGTKFDLKVKEIFSNAIIEKSKSKDFNDDLINNKVQFNLDKKEITPIKKVSFGKNKSNSLKL